MSSSTPKVAAVMLVNGRPEMVARAIASFRAQTEVEKLQGDLKLGIRQGGYAGVTWRSNLQFIWTEIKRVLPHLAHYGG